jgi:hypothetical protein
MQYLKNLFFKISDWLKSIFGITQIPELQKEWNENEKLHRKLKEVWDSEQKLTGCKIMGLQLVKRAQSGNIYYEPKDFSQITAERMWQLDVIQTKFQYNFDAPENFTYMVSKVSNALLSGSLANAQGAWHEFLERSKQLPTNLLLCQWCAILMIRHDENPYVLDAQTFNEKVLELQKDDTLRAFFLARCMVMLLPSCPVILAKLKDCELDCAQDLVAYSQKIKVAEKLKNH